MLEVKPYPPDRRRIVIGLNEADIEEIIIEVTWCQKLSNDTPQQIEHPQRASWLRRFFPRLVTMASNFVGLIIWIWSIGFTWCLDDDLPVWIARLLALAIAIGFPLLLFRFGRERKLIPLAGLVIVFGACLLTYRIMAPQHDRDWGLAQATLPFARISLDESTGTEQVLITNIRSIRYGPVAPENATHYDDTYDLSKLESVWFGVDRFTEFEPMAHTFLSFGFEPGSHRTNYLAFSVETRREKDEKVYSPIRGIFNNYEVIYVIADEQDVLSVRSDVRQHVVQLYPVRATQPQIRAMFLDMLARANSIRDKPEFYHTLTSNCTNNIVYHTNNVLEKPITAWQRGVIFPGYSDWLAHRLGIINTELSLEEAREKFRVDQRVKAFDGRSDFSEFIRSK